MRAEIKVIICTTVSVVLIAVLASCQVSTKKFRSEKMKEYTCRTCGLQKILLRKQFMMFAYRKSDRIVSSPVSKAIAETCLKEDTHDWKLTSWDSHFGSGSAAHASAPIVLEMLLMDEQLGLELSAIGRTNSSKAQTIWMTLFDYAAVRRMGEDFVYEELFMRSERPPLVRWYEKNEFRLRAGK